MKTTKETEEVLNVAEKIVGRINQFEANVVEKTEKLEIRVKKVEEEIVGLKKKPL